MWITPEDVIKLLLAVLAGGLIGIERELRDKAAGFRTLIFICLGATLFTILSVRLAGNLDHTRIAANVVSGVGFLGAGVIMRSAGRVTGLTTAAMVWLTAALGMGIGGGEYGLSGLAVTVTLLVLLLFPRLEHWLSSLREERIYEIVCPSNLAKIPQLEEYFHRAGMHIWSRRQEKKGSQMICSWQVNGPPKAHDRLVALLFEDREIDEFRY